MAARQILQSWKADVNNELPVGFAITELVVRLGLLQALEHFLGVVWLSLTGN